MAKKKAAYFSDIGENEFGALLTELRLRFCLLSSEDIDALVRIIRGVLDGTSKHQANESTSFSNFADGWSYSAETNQERSTQDTLEKLFKSDSPPRP